MTLRGRTVAAYICIVICLIGVWGCMGSNPDMKETKISISKNVPTSIFDYDNEVYYAYGYFGLNIKKEDYDLDERNIIFSLLSENESDWTNTPWIISARLIRNLVLYNQDGRVDSSQLEQCVSVMEGLKERFEHYGKYPRRAYQQYPVGWVSSMDAPVVMVASRMLYEVTGDEKWHDFVKELSKYVTKDISEDGFNFRLGEKEIWPLEYAQKNLTFNDAEFVLNGSLVGYLSIYMIAEVEKDDSLMKYLECVERAYEKMFPKFPYSNYTWTKYALNPPVICNVHYAFFEWELFGALSKLTGNPMFERELSYRTACLKNVLKPQFKNIDGEICFIIHRACPPHPYMIDCYPSKLVFYDGNDREVASSEETRNGHRDSMELFKDGEFLLGKVPSEAVRYTYFRSDAGIEIFGGNIEANDFVTGSDVTKICGYALRVENDAQVLDNGDIHIANNLSEKLEGTLIYDLHSAEELDDQYLYGIEIENLTDMELKDGLIIRDSNAGATRYYTPLFPGKNLVVFNILGLRDLDRIKKINRIDLRLYTNENNVDGICRVGRILRFKDLFEFREYRMDSGYEIPPQ